VRTLSVIILQKYYYGTNWLHNNSIGVHYNEGKIFPGKLAIGYSWSGECYWQI